MNNVKVYSSHEDIGTGVQYFRTVPNKQLICIVDDTWYDAKDDNTWEEPGFPINMEVNSIDIISKKEANYLIKKSLN